MIYRDFGGEKLSALGLGCMRLPVIDGKDGQIDVAQVDEMVDCALANGINYFDTAWGYHGGMSQVVIAKSLSRYPRERWLLANKFPGYDTKNFGHVEEIFEEQLKKCGVEYFDFYLFHNVCESNIEYYLDPKYGTFEWLVKQKENGRIHHLGFSAHGSVETITRFLDAYGDKMEFCQLQLNYIDMILQNGAEKVKLLNEHNIPIWVMEPVRGGKLATLDACSAEALGKVCPDRSPVEWAFRFLQGIPGVGPVLSGMSDMAQLKQNIEIFAKDEPLTESEDKALLDVAEKLINRTSVPCTACHYCVDYCPNGLDIPTLLGLYNEHSFTGGGFLAPMHLSVMDKKPSDCVGCRSCESVCPQNIKISEALADFADMLGN